MALGEREKIAKVYGWRVENSVSCSRKNSRRLRTESERRRAVLGTEAGRPSRKGLMDRVAEKRNKISNGRYSLALLTGSLNIHMTQWSCGKMARRHELRCGGEAKRET